MRKFLVEKIYSNLNDYSNKINEFHFLKNPINNNFKKSGGVYFFFENFKTLNLDYLKIIYIGITKNNENNRLEKHQKGDASSFRKHVSESLEKLTKVAPSPNIIDDYIHNLPYLFIPISNDNDIKTIEKATIEIISNFNQEDKIKPVNESWLGNSSGDDKIIKSQLWNWHHVSNFKISNIENYNKIIDLLNFYIIKLK